jgi:hypothetical protein
LKKTLFITGLVASFFVATGAKAQSAIEGKHWHRVTSKDGKISIPEHSVITYIATSIEGARGGEKVVVGDIAYSTAYAGIITSYSFTGEMYTGNDPLDIHIENARKETYIVVCYYN